MSKVLIKVFWGIRLSLQVSECFGVKSLDLFWQNILLEVCVFFLDNHCFPQDETSFLYLKRSEERVVEKLLGSGEVKYNLMDPT